MSSEASPEAKPNPKPLKGILKKPSAPPNQSTPTKSTSSPSSSSTKPSSSTPAKKSATTPTRPSTRRPSQTLSRSSQPPSPQSPTNEEENEEDLPLAEQQRRREASARLRLLQQIKSQVLPPPVPIEVFEHLCTLPTTSNPASSPSAEDIQTFLNALQKFQPREYLDLIEERNCLGKCGYTLCPRPRRQLPGPYKITRSGVGKAEELNKWCSDACAARALYIKVQLDNPSYERRKGPGGKDELFIKLELRAEKGPENKTEMGRKTAYKDEQAEKDLADAMARLELDKATKAKKDAAQLALERGDAAGGLFAAEGRVEVVIQEKEIDEPVVPPNPGDQDSHLYVEGYKSGTGTKKRSEDDDSDDDEFFSIKLR